MRTYQVHFAILFHGVGFGLTDKPKSREVHLSVRVGVGAVHDEGDLSTTNWKPQRSHQHLRGGGRQQHQPGRSSVDRGGKRVYRSSLGGCG